MRIHETPVHLAGRLRVHPLDAAFGARVSGLALSALPDTASLQSLRAALRTHRVLVFENQRIDASQQRAWADRFAALAQPRAVGVTEGAAEIAELDTREAGPGASGAWLTDASLFGTLSTAALQYAGALPAAGCSTHWSDLVAAYQGLSEGFRRLIAGLVVAHDLAKFPAASNLAGPAERAAQVQALRRRHPPESRPPVRRHPASGQMALAVDEAVTTRIEGLSAQESDTLLWFLFEHLGKPEFSLRWNWKVGDAVLWDSGRTIHWTAADRLPRGCLMRRATIDGWSARRP